MNLISGWDLYAPNSADLSQCGVGNKELVTEKMLKKLVFKEWKREPYSAGLYLNKTGLTDEYWSNANVSDLYKPSQIGDWDYATDAPKIDLRCMEFALKCIADSTKRGKYKEGRSEEVSIISVL